MSGPPRDRQLRVFARHAGAGKSCTHAQSDTTAARQTSHERRHLWQAWRVRRTIESDLNDELIVMNAG